MSGFSNLVPLLVLIIFLGVAAFIGYACYTIANEVADKTAKKMEKRHLSITKEGMVVGVKEKKTEHYVDQTQRLVRWLSLYHPVQLKFEAIGARREWPNKSLSCFKKLFSTWKATTPKSFKAIE